ncbi:Myotubularin-related protein 7 [Liparis tanakae]|uniref:Myotubularin-related protein 7 n=1 Tax=Liparis tanakae TaxID=230148 RepID=A0A4Z2E765_9TELE|nr:Myotubularin-related protein 7 [Liparis tanakae]
MGLEEKSKEDLKNPNNFISNCSLRPRSGSPGVSRRGCCDVKVSVGVNEVQRSVCERRSMPDFLGALESSGWLKDIKAALDAGIFIAEVGPEVTPC